MEATITLEYRDAKTADAIASAVSPDNFKTPAGLSIKTVRKGIHVLTEIKTEGKLATFIATIDDLLFCVSTAEKMLHTVTKARLCFPDKKASRYRRHFLWKLCCQT